MSSTRYAQPDADPDEANERYLASAKLRGLGVGLNIVCRVARVAPQSERAAMIWLANYARLRDSTIEDLRVELGMAVPEIRDALTNPECDRKEFVFRVQQRREAFEAERSRVRPPGESSAFELLPALDEALAPIAETTVVRKVRNAFKMALQKPQIIEIVGKSRIGKSMAARHEYLGLLDRAAWLHCPKVGTEREYLAAIAAALGMGISSATKNAQLIQKISACFGRKKIDLLVVDEGHRTVPVESDLMPSRLEYLRDLWETLGVSVILLATPQFTAGMVDLKHGNPRWAPSQWLGRVQPFHLPETLSSADLEAVARFHAPEADAEIIAEIVAHAANSNGFCGDISRAVERARFRADGALTLADVKAAHLQLEAESRTAETATLRLVPKRPRGRPKGSSPLKKAVGF